MKRKPIRLTKDQDHYLRKQYKQWGIPRGQYKSHWDYMEAFTERFNAMMGCSFTPNEVYHYIETQQKITSRLEVPWPRFEGAHKRLPPIASVLTPAHLKALRTIWRRFIAPRNLGTDAVAYCEELVQLLSHEFYKATKLHVPGMVLLSAVENERKQGNWDRLKDSGFDDLDLLA